MDSSKLHNNAELYSVAADVHISLDLKGYGLMNKTGLIYTNIGGKKAVKNVKFHKGSALQKQEECGQAILHILMLDRSASKMKPMDHHHPLMCDIT